MQDELYNFLFDSEKTEPEQEQSSFSIDDIINRESEKYGLDSNITRGLIKTESGGDPQAKSHAGAQGLMQLMPSTSQAIAKELGEEWTPEKMYDPETNIRYGTYLLAQNKNRFGSYEPALAAYHGGPGVVRSDGSINPNSNDGLMNTTDYVQTVLANSKNPQRFNSDTNIKPQKKDERDELFDFLEITPIQEKETTQTDTSMFDENAVIDDDASKEDEKNINRVKAYAGQLKEGTKDVARSFTALSKTASLAEIPDIEKSISEKEKKLLELKKNIDRSSQSILKDKSIPKKKRESIYIKAKRTENQVKNLEEELFEEKNRLVYAKDNIRQQTKIEKKFLNPDSSIQKLPGVEGFVQDVIRGIPQLAAQIGVGAATGGAGSTLFMGAQIAGSEAEQLQQEGVTAKDALNAAIASAVLQAPLEKIGLDKALAGGGSPLRRVITGFISEAVTEGLQTIPSDITSEIAKADGKTVEEKLKNFGKNFWTHEHLWNLAKRAAYEGAVGGVLGAGASGGNIVFESVLNKKNLLEKQLENKEITEEQYAKEVDKITQDLVSEMEKQQNQGKTEQPTEESPEAVSERVLESTKEGGKVEKAVVLPGDIDSEVESEQVNKSGELGEISEIKRVKQERESKESVDKMREEQKQKDLISSLEEKGKKEVEKAKKSKGQIKKEETTEKKIQEKGKELAEKTKDKRVYEEGSKIEENEKELKKKYKVEKGEEPLGSQAVNVIDKQDVSTFKTETGQSISYKDGDKYVTAKVTEINDDGTIKTAIDKDGNNVVGTKENINIKITKENSGLLTVDNTSKNNIKSIVEQREDVKFDGVQDGFGTANPTAQVTLTEKGNETTLNIPLKENMTQKEINSEIDSRINDYKQKQAEFKKQNVSSKSEVKGQDIELDQSKAKKETEVYKKSEENIEQNIDEKSNTPLRKITKKIAEIIGSEKLDNKKLKTIADKIFKGKRGEEYQIKDAYDAMEAGLNEHIKENNLVDFNDDKKTIENLKKVTNNLARQTVRTEGQIELQQFSTPPIEAYVTTKSAGIQPGMTVLEPSAGTGSIAVMADIAGAKVIVNEIDKTRSELLKNQGYEQYSVDAEYLNNFLPDNVKPDVVVMNPPFSSTGGRVKGHDTKFGARHVEQALLRVKDGGRVVAIVGRGMAFGKPKMAKWWGKILKKYNVRANIGTDGKYYGKMGTTFDNNIIVIDKTGPTPGETYVDKIKNVIKGEKINPEQALELLNDISKENVYERLSEFNQRKTTSYEPKPKVPNTGTDKNKTVSQRGSEQQTERGDVGKVLGVSEQLSSKPRTETSTDSGTRRTDNSKQGNTRRSSSSNIELENQKGSTEQEGAYTKYKVRKAKVKGSQPHPANIVESSTLAAVEQPTPTYKPDIPEDIIKEGRLLDVQLEQVVYAGQKHEQRLPSGERAEYLIGDGTGVGKGREISGIILDNWNKGRKKHVWISFKKELAFDAQRDLDGIGANIPLIKQGSFKAGDQIGQNEGIVFTQYSLLSNGWKGNRKRLNQLIEWLGEDFDGVIAFDESHQMKNAAAYEFAKLKEGTNQGQMGLEIKKIFPNARILNVSATPATTPANMSYLSRIGLWGPGTAFESFSSFLSAISNAGVAGMEMVSRDLKAMGSYLARSISYKGVKYENVTHKLTNNEIKEYDEVAKLWSTLQNEFNEAEINSGNKKGNSFSQFWGTNQRFFLQYMMSLQLPDLIADAEKQLASGKSVVISLFNTNEQAAKQKILEAKAQGIELDEVDFSPKQMIVQLIERHFPIHQYTEVTDPDTGSTVTVKMLDASGNPVINKENQRKQAELLDIVYNFKMPDNPLDVIINHFGPNKVAEATGRKQRREGNKVVNRKIKGVPQKMLNEQEVKLFQSGKKRIAVLSGAASTGISLHSDINAKNNDQRVFYSLQLSWSADTQMQMFGRVHRSFQKSAPIIKIVQTNLSGQKRLVNAISKRLASLGAVSAGTREAYSGSVFEVEDITNEYGQAALNKLYQTLPNSTLKKLGVLDNDGNVKQSLSSNVDNFLNRIMGLPVKEQNQTFDDFYTIYRELYENDLAKGKVDLGVEEIKAENIKTIKSEEVYADNNSGAKTNILQIEGDVPVSILPFEQAQNISNEFYQNKKSKKIYALKKQSDLNVENNEFPLLDHKNRTVLSKDINKGYIKVSEQDAKAIWDKLVESEPKTKKRKYALVTGVVLPVYDKIQNSVGNVRLKAMRANTDQGSVLGLNIPIKSIPAIKLRMGIDTGFDKLSVDEIVNMVDNGSVIELDNGWLLKQSKISGDERIELVTRHSNNEELSGYGLYNEIINYNRRWFVPIKNSKKVLESLFKIRKPISDKTSSSVQDNYYADDSNREQELKDRILKSSEKSMKKETNLKTSKTEILNYVKKAFGVEVLGRATNRWKSAGRYYPDKVVIRIRKGGHDIYTLIHEVAHHIDNMLKKKYGNNWKAKSNALQELRDLDYDPTKKRTAEGFAEYFRKKISNEGFSAPVFDPWFNSFLDGEPKLKKQFNDLYKMVRTYHKQGAANRLMSQVDWRGEHKPLQKASLYDWWVQKFVTSLRPVSKIMKAIGIKSRKNIAITQDPMEMATFLMKKSASVANTVIRKKMINPHGQVIGKGLQEILDQVSVEKTQDAIIYTMALRAQQLESRGIDSGLDIDDVNYFVKENQSEVFDNFAQDLTVWSNQLLDWLIYAGSVSGKEAQLMREMNPIYVPFKRIVEDQITFRGAGAKGVQKIKGSTRPIVNPIESLINHATAIIQKSHKVQIASIIADLAQNKNAGGFINKVPAPVGHSIVRASELVRKLKQEGYDVSEADTDKLLNVITAEAGFAQNNIVSIWKNGKREYYEIVNKDLLSAINSLEMPQRNVLVKILSPFAKMTRMGATSLKIAFSLVKNPSRDIPMLFVSSKKKTMNPIDIVNAVWKNATKKQSDPLWRYLALGGQMSGIMGYDRATTMNIYDELMFKKMKLSNKPFWVVKHPVSSIKMAVGVIQDILGVSETLIRTPEFLASYKRYSAKIGTSVFPTEFDAFVAAFNDAQDVTVNFTRSGEYGSQINQAVGFFNASIQGTDKVIRMFKENPIQTSLKGILYLTLPAVLLHFLNREKDWYKNLPLEYKYSGWFIELPNGEVVRVPLPFDLGVIFAGIPLAAIEHNKESGEAVLNNLKSLLPPIVPNMFAPLIDLARNRNWLERPIVPESVKRKYPEPSKQANEYTSEYSKIVANALAKIGVHWSPIQIDYAINQYTGGFSRQLPNKKIKELADVPVIGEILVRAPEKPRRQLEIFWEDYMEMLYLDKTEMPRDKQIKFNRYHNWKKKKWDKYYKPYLKKYGADPDKRKQIYKQLQRDLDKIL